MTRRRHLRPLLGALLAPTLSLALVALAPWVSVPAAAEFGLYFRTFGAWTVVCSKREPAAAVECRTSAPPATLVSGVGVSVVTVREALADFYEIHIQLRGAPDPGLPFSVRIGGGASMPVSPDRFGDKTWVGTEAAPMIRAMQGGGAMVIQRQGRTEEIPLTGFPSALATMRDRARAYGAIQPAPEPPAPKPDAPAPTEPKPKAP